MNLLQQRLGTRPRSKINKFDSYAHYLKTFSKYEVMVDLWDKDLEFFLIHISTR